MSRTLSQAIDDARSLIAKFNLQQIGDEDCTPEARERIAALEAALDRAIHYGRGDAIQVVDASSIENARQALQRAGVTSGIRTRGLVGDIARLFDTLPRT